MWNGPRVLPRSHFKQRKEFHLGSRNWKKCVNPVISKKCHSSADGLLVVGKKCSFKRSQDSTYHGIPKLQLERTESATGPGASCRNDNC